MRHTDWQPTEDRMLQAYGKIEDQHGAGDPLLPLWHAALRQIPWAMTELARRLTGRGTFADSFSATGLARRAFRLGNPVAAHNLSKDAFNHKDLAGYRYWLVRSIDPEDAAELKRFETRLPHANAPHGHRRPLRRSERAALW